MDKKYISCLVNDKVGVCAISLVLDKRHVRNGGKYPIALRFTIDRKRLYYPLGDKYTSITSISFTMFFYIINSNLIIKFII